MKRILRFSVPILLALFVADSTAFAQRKGANTRSESRSSVQNKNVNRNRNVNRNTNIDVDRDIDIDVDVNHRVGCCYHDNNGLGVVAAVATTAIVTAAIVGSMTPSLPPNCALVMVNGFTYQQCGTVWYQPQITSSSTTYLVVNAPR